MLLQGKPPQSPPCHPLASFRSSNLQHPSVFISDGCHRTYCKLTDSTLQKLLMPQVSGPEAQQCLGRQLCGKSLALPASNRTVLQRRSFVYTHLTRSLFCPSMVLLISFPHLCIHIPPSYKDSHHTGAGSPYCELHTSERRCVHVTLYLPSNELLRKFS